MAVIVHGLEEHHRRVIRKSVMRRFLLLGWAALCVMAAAAAAAPLSTKSFEDLPIGETVLPRTLYSKVRDANSEWEYQMWMRFRPDMESTKTEIAWQPLTDFSKDGKFKKKIVSPGIYDFQVNVRQATTHDLVEQKYLGQINVISDAHLSQLTFYAQDNLQVLQVPISYYVLQPKSAVSAAADTPADFYRYVEQTFSIARFPEKLRTLDPDLLFSLHAMNVVSSLFHYGNIKDTSGAGCVLKNETGSQVKNFSEYVRSNIGCCIDYVMILQLLLDRHGLENSLIIMPGHVQNEVTIRGVTHTLDPTVNLAFITGIRNVLDEKPDAYILSFPHVASTYGHPFANPLVGSFRRMLLAWIALSDSTSMGPPDPHISDLEFATLRGEPPKPQVGKSFDDSRPYYVPTSTQ